MTDDEYTPLIDRARDPKSRIHDELTKPARERIIEIVMNLANENELEHTLTGIQREIALSELYSGSKSLGTDARERTIRLLLNANTEHSFYFIERIFHTIYDLFGDSPEHPGFLKGAAIEERGYSLEAVSQAVKDIRNVLVTERILWKVEHQKGRYVEFHKIESESFVDSDSRVQALAETKPWDSALRGYNDAFEHYSQGDFNEEIPKKLYYSIEETLQIICVDQEEWTENRDLSHSEYLTMLREHGVYDANGVTAAELGGLLNSLERMVSKISDDRKQRHAYHDRVYATLLIHQVGAYLYFLINRYEDFAQ